MVKYYSGNQPGNPIGLLDAQYYWWESGAFFDTLIQYWHLTSDAQYNGIVTQGLLAQQGPDADYMPPNQTKSEGNDDQLTWALAAMSAAELQLPETQNASWVALSETVFNEQVARWDDSSCSGGIRWQIFAFNTGYDYKNSITQGDFFQLAARLARYTGNTTYSDWASKAFNWTQTIGFIDAQWNVYDGAHTETSCTDVNKVQFSYVAGTFISGAAYMYNITSGDAQTGWKGAIDGLLNNTVSIFFPNDIATETACEPHDTCTIDMTAYKGLLAQQLVDTIQVAPYTANTILPLITSSAKAAAQACTDTGCPLKWNTTASGNSSDSGVGTQIDALSFVQGLLVGKGTSPATSSSGGSNSTSTSGPGSTSTLASTSSKTSGTGTPSATGNAGIAIRSGDLGMGMCLGLLGAMAWLML